MPGRSRGSRSTRQLPLSQRSVPSSQQNVVEEEEIVIEETQDEDIAPSQVVSQARKVLSNISPEIVTKKVNDLVQYLLIMERKKYPVKRLEINKIVLKEHSKGFAVFMEKAKKILNEVFGYKLVEIDSKQKSYILINSIEQDPNMPLGIDKEEKAKMGLVMVILSVIFMKGNVIQDAELYSFLKKMSVDIHSSTHEAFGDVKKFITIELVRQGYLDFQRLQNSDPASYEVRWGPRAKLELTKANALKFVCKLYQQQDPSIWTDQFRDVEEANE